MVPCSSSKPVNLSSVKDDYYLLKLIADLYDQCLDFVNVHLTFERDVHLLLELTNG